MEIYTTEHRLTDRWMAIIIIGFYMIAVAILVREGIRDVVAGLPLFALLGYGTAAAFRNRIRVVVNREGIRVENGPLPVQPATPTVERAQVARVYVRHAYMPTRFGGVFYLAAGVERSDGTWLDLSAPGIPDEDVWRRANQIARSLEWSGPVEELHGRAPKADPRGTRVAWYWTAAGLGAMLWGCAVEVLFVAL